LGNRGAALTSSTWRAAGAALESLDRLSVLLLVGDSTVSLAAAARGVAGAAAESQRVAIFDLAGAFGLYDPDGLVAAFREGRSLNALARPLSDGDDNHFVVPRGPGEIDHAFTRHERWPRLVGGFRDTGALLVIAARSDLAGLDDLSKFSDLSLCLLERDGVCRLVPWPPSDADLFADLSASPGGTIAPSAGLMAERVRTDFTPSEITNETADAPLVAGSEQLAEPIEDDPELAEELNRGEPEYPTTGSSHRKSPPPLVRLTPQSSLARVRARRRISWVVVGIVLVLSIGGWYWSFGPGRSPATPDVPQTLASAGAPVSLPDSAFALPDVINPEDSSRTAAWGVELVATNDRSDAAARLADNAGLSAATISPMVLGADGGTWYKVIVGAFVDRTGAEYLRATLRQGGTIDPDAGVVALAPYAFRLDYGLGGEAAKARVVRYVARGVAAYALLDESSQASVYVGAFASPDQAVILLAELRAAGLEPELAYRVGRTF
jgi:hypothetical protein